MIGRYWVLFSSFIFTSGIDIRRVINNMADIDFFLESNYFPTLISFFLSSDDISLGSTWTISFFFVFVFVEKKNSSAKKFHIFRSTLSSQVARQPSSSPCSKRRYYGGPSITKKKKKKPTK